MADNQPPPLDYYTPDPVAIRLRSRDRVPGIVYCTLAARIIGGSLADWLGLPGVTLIMSFVVIVATAGPLIGRLRPPGSAG
jgi:hypothetical protein